MPCADLKKRRFVSTRLTSDTGVSQIVEAGLAAGFEHAIAAQGRKTRALLRAGSKTTRLGRGAWAFDRHLRLDSRDLPGDVNLLRAKRRVKLSNPSLCGTPHFGRHLDYSLQFAPLHFFRDRVPSERAREAALG